jgi:hypothetical protein
MKVTGGTTLHAPVGTVWAALNDPAVLVQAIPGCERLTATAPDTYELTVTAGVGTITGTYTGEISLTDQRQPTSFLLKAAGSGTPGTISTSVYVRLADDGNGSTQLTYDATATIGGMIAGVGQRMLAGVAKRQASQFFTAIDEFLLSQAGESGGEPAAAAGGHAGAGTRPGGGLPDTGGSTVPAGWPAGAAAAPGEGSGHGAVTETAANVPGRRPAGAAGVSSGPRAATQGVSGMTWERSTVPGQPAGRRGAGLPAGRLGARTPTAGFLPGVLVGAGVALAGVVVGGLIGRRKR